jgi:hypothetical protein
LNIPAAAYVYGPRCGGMANRGIAAGEGAELMLDYNPTVEERRAVRRAYRAW